MRLDTYNQGKTLSVFLFLVIPFIGSYAPEQVYTAEISTKIAAGYEHTLVLDDGLIQSWGNNKDGQLGNGTIDNWSHPSKVLNIKNFKALAKGSSANHNLAVHLDGTLWAWGNNKQSQLGIGNKMNFTVPRKVQILEDVVEAAVGQTHSLAVKNDGTVWTWGNGPNGQLGNPIKTESNIPIKVRGMSNVDAVAAGAYHSLALKADGTVWSWGKNTNGQLGISRLKETRLPVQVENLNDIVQISAGNSHNVAVRADGTVWTWGWNDYGQLGNYTILESSIPVKVDIDNVVAVSAGGVHTLALKADGTIWAWGCNIFGQLGQEKAENHPYPVQLLDIADIIAIDAGDLHSVALKKDGTIVTWGSNSKGQLGNDNTRNRFSPVAVTNITVPLPSSEPIIALRTIPKNMNNNLGEDAIAYHNASRKDRRNWSMKGGETQKQHFKIPISENVLIDTAARFYDIPEENVLVDTAQNFYRFTEDENKEKEDCPIIKTLSNVQIKASCTNDNNIHLKWLVDLEAENIDFTIERKIVSGEHKSDWTIISPVQYMEEGANHFEFEATDDDILSGPVFYRLKQLDCEGNEQISYPVVRTCR